MEFLSLEQYFLCPGYKESRLYFLLVLEQLYFLFKSMYVCIYILNQFGGYSDVGYEVWVQFYFIFKLLLSCLIAIYLKCHLYSRDLKCHFDFILNFPWYLSFWTGFGNHTVWVITLRYYTLNDVILIVCLVCFIIGRVTLSFYPVPSPPRICSAIFTYLFFSNALE